MDRAFNGPVLVGSPDGGMDIEEVAEKTPERIFTMPIDITDGISIKQVYTVYTTFILPIIFFSFRVWKWPVT